MKLDLLARSPRVTASMLAVIVAVTVAAAYPAAGVTLTSARRAAPDRSATPSVTAAARAARSDAACAPAPETAPAPRIARAGMVAGIDPNTGRLAPPTAEQLRALAGSAPPASALRPSPVTHANGSVSLDVRSLMRDYAVARIGPGGRLLRGCATATAPAISSARALQAPSVTEER